MLAALVVFLFLRSWRATVITALAMPVSLIPAFAVMHYMGFSLNMITLLALTLVIGILVDDAIVEIENIQKRVEAGQKPYTAAMEGADQIGLAVLATTLTIVVVFLPGGASWAASPDSFSRSSASRSPSPCCSRCWSPGC